MSYGHPPHVPRKPDAYTNGRQAATMQDLLGSLNIDDDDHDDFGGSAQYSGSYNTDPRQGTRPAYHYDNQIAEAGPVRSPGGTQGGRERHQPSLSRSSGTRRDTLYNPSYSGLADHRPTHHDTLQYGTDTGASSGPRTNPESAPDTRALADFPGKRPVRKPVQTEGMPESRRSYFSPNDLDELLASNPRIQDRQHQHRHQHQHQQQPPQLRSSISDSSRPDVPQSRSGSTFPQTTNHDGTSRNRHISFAGQRPHVDDHSSLFVPTRAAQLGDESSSYMQDASSMPRPAARYLPSSTVPYDGYPAAEHDRLDDRRSQSINFDASHSLPYRQHQGVLRLPSPPTRSDSMPLAASRISSPEAFQQRSDLVPAGHRYSSISPEPDFRPPVRQNSAPIRPMSSISNHSQRSPDRQYRHPISELEAQYGGRIPSPDRSQQFPDILSLSDEERVGAASVPPSTQARRGRQKGEVVVESDLPAMPPLFADQDESRSLPRVPQTLGLNRSPSPMKNPATQQPHSPRKRVSMVREYDTLQSVKSLPLKPVKCPPLCLEERFHPSTFVKTNKFKIKVLPASDPFVAGGEIAGHIDIVSDEGFRAQLGSTQVLVGDIGVEIIGYEEISHPESGHKPRSVVFLYGRKVFQQIADKHPIRAAEEHILTSAVVSNPLPDQDGYRVAARGTTSFPFAFPLPVDCPTSADVGVGRINYVVTGYATVKLQGSQETIATSHSVRVVEAWDMGNPVYKDPIEASQGRDIENYHEVAAVAKIEKSLYIQGQTVQGSIRVVNHSSKKVREVKYFLVNKVTFFGDRRQMSQDLNPAEDYSVEQTVSGHAEQHVILKGGEQIWNFTIQIPVDRCLSIRNSALFEVTPFILIKISTGPLNKSTRLAFPPMCVASADSMVDGLEKKAPTSAQMQWANLPSLYRFQRVIDREPQEVEKGFLEVTDLMLYKDAHERVTLLTT